MKYKQSEAQNQRIERISTTHLIVGIDIAKDSRVRKVEQTSKSNNELTV
ncbi:hypothetical protein [Paenibacillus guangzhouensis]|nr:hypothetical protein [Paenibacillus guangzhouensis]